MNCIDFRRIKLADPRRVSAVALAHAESCAGCSAFAREVDEMELELQRTLAIPVPDGLADRIMLRVSDRVTARWHRWGIAATVGLSFIVGLSYYSTFETQAHPYARLAIEHVMMEPESFTTVRNATAEGLGAALNAFGGSLKRPIEKIRYVRLCPMEEGLGWHIVFETPDGLATLILVPGKLQKGIQTASIGGWRAAVHPARDGYFVIVTGSGAAMASTERFVREHIDWDA
jgi:hypothetical protein